MQLTPENQKEFYDWSVTHSREFWTDSARALNVQFKGDFALTPESVVDASDPKKPLWFKGAKMNIADTLLRKAQTEPDAVAFTYKNQHSEVTHYTYRDLDAMSNRFANGLVARGLKPGDSMALCVAGINPDGIAAYLGAMKAGVTMVGLKPDDSADWLKKKLDQLPQKPKLLVVQDYVNKLQPRIVHEDGKEKQVNPCLYERCQALGIPSVVIRDEKLPAIPLDGADRGFNDFVRHQSDRFESVPLDPTAHVAVLFSSGTTGTPKAIPWRADSYIKSANDARLHMEMTDKDTLCWPTNFGWMMGSFDLAAAFMNGGRLAGYEGAYNRHYGEFLRDAGVTVLGIVPEVGEHFQRTKALEGLDLSKIKRVSSTAAASRPENYQYLQDEVFKNANFCEYSGGTEIAGGLNSCLPLTKNKVSTFNTPTFGTRLEFCVNPDYADARQAELFVVVSNKNGYVPPMGLSNELLNPDKSHDEEYFKDNLTNENGELLREHGDIVEFLEPRMLVPGAVGVEFVSRGRKGELINCKGTKAAATAMNQWIMDGAAAFHFADLVEKVAVVQPKGDSGGNISAFVMLTPQAKELCARIDRGENIESLSMRTLLADGAKGLIDRFNKAIKANGEALMGNVSNVVLQDKIPDKVPYKEYQKQLDEMLAERAKDTGTPG